MARILYFYSYGKGLDSHSHNPGPVGLAGTLPERPFQLLASFVDGFPAAGLNALRKPISLFLTAAIACSRLSCPTLKILRSFLFPGHSLKIL